MRKYVENSNPSEGVISHEDQTVHGLRFRSVLRANEKEYIVVEGTTEAIAAYIMRRPTVKKVTKASLQTLFSKLTDKEEPCSECGAMRTVKPPKFSDVEAIELQQ